MSGKEPVKFVQWGKIAAAQPKPAPAEIEPAVTEPTNPAPAASARSKTAAPAKRRSAPLQIGGAADPAPADSAGQWTPHLNHFWDHVAPTLAPLEVVVVGHLLRLTVGFERETCTIGLPRLAERCNVSLNTLRGALRQLQRRGLIECVEVQNAVANPVRGSVFRVLLALPARPPAESARSKTARAGSAPAAPAPMISDQKHDHTAVAAAPVDIYEVRKIAATVREVNHARLGYDAAQFRHDVRMALIGAGKDCGDETMDEATAGMIQ